MGVASYFEDIIKRLESDLAMVDRTPAVFIDRATNSTENKRWLSAIKRSCEAALRELHSLTLLATDPAIDVAARCRALETENDLLKASLGETTLRLDEAHGNEIRLVACLDVALQDKKIIEDRLLNITKNVAESADRRRAELLDIKLKNLSKDVAEKNTEIRRLCIKIESLERGKLELKSFRENPERFYNEFLPSGKK